MGKRRKRRIYTCSDKILCGLGRMYAGGEELTENIDDVGGKKVTLEKACGMGLPEHYFRIFRLIFSNSLPPRVLWVRSLLLLPDDAFFRYCPGVQPLC